MSVIIILYSYGLYGLKSCKVVLCYVVQATFGIVKVRNRKSETWSFFL
jgi:hypothetical protein